MFEKLAKFRPFEPQRMAPRPIAATHSNDNLPGFRHPEGRGRRPTPAPACHWVLIDGHLECRWTVETSTEPTNGERCADRPSGPRTTIARAAKLKMAASA
ncbi:hypothetical protein JQ559_30065 [Bradyrhizobium viridifuturi]|jgi:hypothetical protein|uniref:hypothetical protein n=1 Tax=Bradyrhizobium TaxID=374 RepID=UPI0003985920|nr:MULTISPECIES: hypothetical protein [Bradyrhizobium]ERF80830.1 MAG: hypothetical protein C207_05917 [Bradyrhizobium sp. DFCI-1]QRI70192.1 hypothetical protein JQ507_01205 [Bradyrhizobium sp. PSBB068]MBR1023521.1 hypothetical protein [Bradyrhizobium viridifuturi]MBR1040398.1 hypothetical protein [Bradyrhizobium viridifuturi]MBR1047909.1 hypothetical protein [Bradyrhizobium viridifuturi]